MLAVVHRLDVGLIEHQILHRAAQQTEQPDLDGVVLFRLGSLAAVFVCVDPKMRKGVPFSNPAFRRKRPRAGHGRSRGKPAHGGLSGAAIGGAQQVDIGSKGTVHAQVGRGVQQLYSAQPSCSGQVIWYAPPDKAGLGITAPPTGWLRFPPAGQYPPNPTGCPAARIAVVQIHSGGIVKPLAGEARC